MMCPSHVITPPNPSLLASTQTANSLSRSSTLRFGVVVNSYFSLSKLSWNFLQQLNFIPFFYSDVIR